MTKIERETIIHYTFQSKAKDIGAVTMTLKLLRKNPSLESQKITSKAVMTGGIPPITAVDNQFIDTICTLSTYVVPIVNGKEVKGSEWIEDLADEAMMYDIHKKWIEYQNSFYPDVKFGGTGADTTQSSVSP